MIKRDIGLLAGTFSLATFMSVAALPQYAGAAQRQMENLTRGAYGR